jgi:hypothetical protein
VRIIGPALFVLAGVIWIATVITVLRLARRLSGRRSLWQMLFNGIAWFDARNFRPDAAGLALSFRVLFAAFFVCLLVGIVAVFLTLR